MPPHIVIFNPDQWRGDVVGHLLRAYHGEPNAFTLLKRAGYYGWWRGKNRLVPAEHGFDAYCDVKFRPEASDDARWGHAPRPFAQTGNQADPSLPDWRGAPGRDTCYSFHVGALPTDGDDLYCDPD